jgi:CDP-paratose 2-epimerase
LRDTLLVTGSSGLVGSEVAEFFCRLGWRVHGIDNHMRAEYFGSGGDSRWNRVRLESHFPDFVHHELDIRDRLAVQQCVEAVRPILVVHAAAQPSHDLAASRPFDDFDVNATGTLNLLEAVRRHAPTGTFVHLSTNKVYGDAPNRLRMTELERRWECVEERYAGGIPESFPIDQCLHSIFGASKLAADVMVQEYGRYFDMRTCSLRGGCITGGNHGGVELHGFLSYLIRCHLDGTLYRVYGYGGKQVRDNIHAYDVATFILAFHERPRPGEVYNLGGGRANSCSILEAFDTLAALTGRRTNHEFVTAPRSGDHRWYVSDLSKARQHYDWSVTRSLESIFEEILGSWEERLARCGMAGG